LAVARICRTSLLVPYCFYRGFVAMSSSGTTRL
jgi:hypothetical protein